MISRRFYINVLIRVILIMVLSLCLGYYVFKTPSLRISIVIVIAILIIAINLTSYLNTTNRKIKFFFDSVRNDDSNLSFPVNSDEQAFSELNKSMNDVNKQIQQLKIENRQQEQYFQILLENVATGVITFNRKGFILHANSSAKRLLSSEVLTHLQQFERIDHKLYDTVVNIKPSERRLVAIDTERGIVQLSLKAASYATNDNELIILSIQDIKNELDEKELESWMKLIRVLMHEIMNSITPITSLSESLSGIYANNGLPVEPEKITVKAIQTTLTGLNVIKEQGRSLMSFVESYRKLTRVPEPDKKLCRVNDLIDRIAVLFSSLENIENIKLNVSIKNPEIEVFADQNLISQVLINLLKNAIEANVNNPEAMINISAGIDNNQRIEICVSDNGPGIAAEKIDEIFVPFFTTKQKGSGIGLSISKQIMKVHGGNLQVRSIPFKETVFCLSF
jgi:two-component system, NtrC family, nitrogen regulation sensor histidine kinase NtrY